MTYSSSQSSEPAASRSPSPETPAPVETPDTLDSKNNPAPAFEGVGAQTVTCPNIRRSHCFFFVEGTRTDEPCHFSFVSEQAYQYHIVHVHKYDHEWLDRWYSLEIYTKDGGGRLPRYPPSEETGVSVVDRKVKDDPERMGQLLKTYYDEDEQLVGREELEGRLERAGHV